MKITQIQIVFRMLFAGQRCRILGLVMVGLLALGAPAQTPVGLGHVDVGVSFEQGVWGMHVHDETVDAEYGPDEAVLVVRDEARTTVPADQRFAFLGMTGAPVWLLSQVENERLLFLGLSAEEVGVGVFQGNRVRVTLKEARGPGHFFLYLASGVTGAPELRMNSRDGVNGGVDFADLVAGRHQDFNWAFTAPGTYTLAFETSGTLADGGQAVVGGPFSFSFQVHAQPGEGGEMAGFYVGVDEQLLTFSGPYAGQPNPNRGRLTFLHAHLFPRDILQNHFHAIGAYEHSRSDGVSEAVSAGLDSRVPEISSARPPIMLVNGVGRFAGKLASAKTAEPYSDLRIRSVHTLRRHATSAATNEFGFGSPQHALFTSDSGRWTSQMNGAVVAMELVEKSHGLHIGTPYQAEVLKNPGDRVVLGGGSGFEFLPVVWSEVDAAPGRYYWRFKLVDASTAPGHTPVPESGVVTFDYQVAGGPSLAIARTVTLDFPLAFSEGHVLERAAAVNGPWAPVNTPPGIVSAGEGEGEQPLFLRVTVPLGDEVQFFRLHRF